MPRKDFIRRNGDFLCLKCGAKNPKAKQSERNHCFSCLHSLHVDLITPGDRKSDCHGLMEPVCLDYKGGKGFMIKHRCVKCGKEILNKTAPDDSVLKLAEIQKFMD